jgi:hypothetical protein
MTVIRTSDVAALLGRRVQRLYQLIEYKKIPAPPRDSAGAYYWLPIHVEAARAYLAAGRPYRPKRGTAKGPSTNEGAKNADC